VTTLHISLFYTHTPACTVPSGFRLPRPDVPFPLTSRTVLVPQPQQPQQPHCFTDCTNLNSTRHSCSGFNTNSNKPELCYDRRSVSQSLLVSGTHLGPMTRFVLLCDSFGFVDMLQLLLVLASPFILGFDSSSSRPYFFLQILVYKVKVKVMLLPTVNRPICIGIRHPSGARYQAFITVGQLLVPWCGALPLTREWVYTLQLLQVLASAVVLGSESRRIHDHILQFQI
jgi:hypothetical protein